MKTENDSAAICDFPPGAPSPYHRPLIPMVLALAAGIFAGGTWPGYLVPIALGGLMVFGCLLHAWIGHRRLGRAPLVLLCLLGYALISPWLPNNFPKDHISRYTDAQRWQIEGQVIQVLPHRHGRTRLILEVRRLKDNQRSFSVRGRIRLSIFGELPPITPGTQLAFESRIRSFHNFNNPGGFDYRRFMSLQRVFGSAYVPADRLDIVTDGHPQETSMITRYRIRARAAIQQIPNPNTQAIMKALLIGERSAITPDLRRVFNRCGVGHLLAISGLHIGIVAGLLIWALQRILNRSNTILDHGWGRRGATLLAAGPIVFYAILAGLSPSTQRALIMVLGFMATLFIHREGDTFNLLALAAFIMLIWHPPALFTISFQMSFVAVFWIIGGLSITSPERKTSPGRAIHWPDRIKTFLLVTLWATLGTLPLTMHYFQEISLIGLVANCVFVPLIGFFVLPCGLCALFILPFSEIIAGWGIQLAGWGLGIALQIMQAFDALDGIALTTILPSSLEILCYYALLGMIVIWRSFRHARWVALLVLIVLAADVCYWCHERFWHRDLRVTVMDVGQGSAALVEFPGGETMLIDGGGLTSNRFFDLGARVIAPFLRCRKIMQIDTIVLSHPNSDHMNGLVYPLTHFNPQRLLWTGERSATESFRLFYDAVVRSGITVPAFGDWPREIQIGGVTMALLHPPAGETKNPHLRSEDSKNDNSIVLKLTLGSSSILFPGDIESSAEVELIDGCRSELPSRVLVAPHHGSRSSSSIAFIAAVKPKIVIFSAGWQNRFGFPHASVLERYQAFGAHTYRTDRDGAIHLRTEGSQWQVDTN
jgi:competence protein ComEC